MPDLRGTLQIQKQTRLSQALDSSSLNGEKATDMDQVYLGDQAMTKGSPGATELIEPLTSQEELPEEIPAGELGPDR